MVDVLQRQEGNGCWKWLCDFSGFAVSMTGQVSAPEECWERLLEKHSQETAMYNMIKYFRKNPLADHNELEEILDGRVATGKFARSSTQEKEFEHSEDDAEEEGEEGEEEEEEKEEKEEEEEDEEVAGPSSSVTTVSTVTTKSSVTPGKPKRKPPPPTKAVDILTKIASELGKKPPMEQVIDDLTKTNWFDIEYSGLQKLRIVRAIDDSTALLYLSLTSVEDKKDIIQQLSDD